MKKIKTIEAVNAYKTLKSLKSSSMSEEVLMSVWKDMKSLRAISDTYNQDVEEANNSLRDGQYEEMAQKAQKLNEKQSKEQKGEYSFSDEDLAEIKEVNKYFGDIKAKTDKYFHELDNKEVEVDIVEVAETELVKVVKACELSLSELEKLECICGAN